MLTVVIAQYHSQKSIRQLKDANAQAVTTFQADNLLDEIINEIYIIEESSARFVTLGDNSQYQKIEQSLKKLQKQNESIRQLYIKEDTGKKIIQSLTLLVIKKTEPFKALQLSSSDSVKRKVFASVKSQEARQLTDSIYVTALKIQLQLEKNLQKTFIENESLSTRVLLLARILGFVSIAAIAFLASIIIRRLVQNYRLIKALEVAKIKAEKVSDIKEQFLANMSHEIRTPINSVLGFTNLLQKTTLKEDQHLFVELIQTASQNLLNIINDILDISKIESGMLHFDKTPFSVRDLCYTVEMMFYHHIEEQKLSFECLVEDDVPDVVAGDKERLTQIFFNLVSNAIKFTKEGEIKVTIELLGKTEKNVRLRFSVKDTGIGIMPDKLETIFERFEQAEASTTRNYGGTGLGLSIVKNLVQLQGGTIVAKSEPGKGAEFIFEMEFELGAENAFVAPKPGFLNKFSHGGEVNALRGLKVLAAEDNKMNQKLLRYIFEQWEIAFELAETGSECIQKIKDGNFDILFMDIQMPEMDGYEAADKIRKTLHSTIPIIAMTANVLPGEKEKCKRMGINDYIAKPLNERILYDLIIKNLPTGFAVTMQKENETPLINVAYLNKIFAGKTLFIKDIVQQFSIQYPIELEELEKAINEKNIEMVKSQSHHMKTTISTINNKSFILEHLNAIESSGSTPSDWDMIQHKLIMLKHSKDELLKEAGNIVLSREN